MSPILSSMLLALILVILGDGVAALLGARACWRIRKRPGAGYLAYPFAIILAALAISSLNEVVNQSVNLRGLECLPKAYLIQSFIGRLLRSAATWYLALRLMNGAR